MPFNRDFTFAGLFRVEIEGNPIGDFQEVKIPTVEVAVTEYKHGSSKSAFKRPGSVKYGNLTLKRGYNVSRDLQTWWTNIQMGKQDRRSISVVQLDEEGGETMRWNMFDCWPCKWTHSGHAGGKDEVITEELEIVVERLEMAG